MIKARTKNGKMYYIFPKNEIGRKETLCEVAIALHEKTEKFEVLEAKHIGEEEGYALYEIGSKGSFWAVTRRQK